jgi:hypothetical protein
MVNIFIIKKWCGAMVKKLNLKMKARGSNFPMHHILLKFITKVANIT